MLEKTIADLKIEIDNSKNGKRNCITCGASPTDIIVKDEPYGSDGIIQMIYKTCSECGNIEKIDGSILKQPDASAYFSDGGKFSDGLDVF